MTKTLAAILLVTAGCLLTARCVKTQPQSPLVHTQKMAGIHTFSGTEMDHITSTSPYNPPPHDTTYTVSYTLDIYFNDNTTIYLNSDNSNSSGNLDIGTLQVTAYDASSQLFTYTYADTCCNLNNRDTLFYDFPNNIITIHEHFENPDGLYVINMRTQ